MNHINSMLEVYSLRDKLDNASDISKEQKQSVGRILETVNFLYKTANMDPTSREKSWDLQNEIQKYTSTVKSLLDQQKN